MKKVLFILTVLSSFLLLGQSNFETELQLLRQEEMFEINRINQQPNSQNRALIANIQAKYQEKENQLRVKYNKIQELKNQQERALELSQNTNFPPSPQINYSAPQRYPSNNFQNNVNSLGEATNNLVMGMQYQAMMNAQNEFIRRQQVANNFIMTHTDRINKILEIYKNIPKKNFNKVLNAGWYNAHLLTKKKYSFYNSQEISTETPCIVYVENDIIKKIHLYGKKQFEENLPKEYPQNSKINNGAVTYIDYAKLETYSVVIIEPYLNPNFKEAKLIDTGVGYIIPYTTNKRDKDKIIYIQEIDKNGNIHREIQSTLRYAKKEKELDLKDNVKVNAGYNLLFFGRVTNTPFGAVSLYPKISEKHNAPLNDNENRFVKVKLYRE